MAVYAPECRKICRGSCRGSFEQITRARRGAAQKMAAPRQIFSCRGRTVAPTPVQIASCTGNAEPAGDGHGLRFFFAACHASLRVRIRVLFDVLHVLHEFNGACLLGSRSCGVFRAICRHPFPPSLSSASSPFLKNSATIRHQFHAPWRTVALRRLRWEVDRPARTIRGGLRRLFIVNHRERRVT